MRKLVAIAALVMIGPAITAALLAAQPQVWQVHQAEQPLPQPRTVGDPSETKLDLVEFRNLPLIEAMRFLSEQSGLKIVPSAKASTTSVSLYLKDVTPIVAVSAVTQANGLVYRR